MTTRKVETLEARVEALETKLSECSKP
jgi:BMFP domain-containing protein YqiC